MQRKIIHYTLLFAIALFAASCSLSQQLKKADKKYALGEYYAAAPLYKRIIPQIPAKDKEARAEVLLKMGNCYLKINDNIRAESAYAAAIRYKMKNQDLYLNYAEVLRKNEKYNEARTYYSKYLFKDSTNVWAKNALASCNNVKKWMKLPSEYSVKKEITLNDRKSDFCPVVGDEDGSLLYFTSSRKNSLTGTKNSKITGIKNNDIFSVKKDLKGKWEAAVALPIEINTANDEGVCSISSDGRIMYFTQCRYVAGFTLGAEIYSTERSGGEWTMPKKVNLVMDSSITVAHPAIAPDDSYLYFVSDMPGGFGGKDIWRAAKISDVEWGEPVNLGDKINTPGDEMFPAFKADGTLYFSSNGHYGFGGLDIYKATLTKTKDKRDAWKVENMLSPINSSGDDFGITFIGRSDKGYFSTNRKEPKGWDKIYSFDVPLIEFVMQGKVLDSKGEPVSDAVVRIVGNNGVNTKIRVKKDGSYKYKLEKDVQYIMQASARGFLNEKANLSTIGQRKNKAFDIDFTLPEAGKPVTVDNIFYEFGKYTLTQSSEEALGGLVKMLTDNPNITIEIGAHTDMVGSEAANLLLSEKRAQSVVDYLIKSGIESARLTPKGYGETKPVTVDKALVSEYPFLNEGDLLDEEFLLKLSEKDREIANKINRRTEFMVMKMTYKMF